MVAIELVKEGRTAMPRIASACRSCWSFLGGNSRTPNSCALSVLAFGKDSVSGDLVFCVIEGYFMAHPYTISHSLMSLFHQWNIKGGS
jgi:hypothetical protein